MYAGMVELVDTLGLEPSALRCAGSSPVPGRVENHSLKSDFLFLWKTLLIIQAYSCRENLWEITNKSVKNIHQKLI